MSKTEKVVFSIHLSLVKFFVEFYMLWFENIFLTPL